MDTQGHVETFARPSHGENRGSSPLGSTNDFRDLVGATHTNEHLQAHSGSRNLGDLAKHSNNATTKRNKDACDVWASTANRIMVCPRECPPVDQKVQLVTCR